MRRMEANLPDKMRDCGRDKLSLVMPPSRLLLLLLLMSRGPSFWHCMYTNEDSKKLLLPSKFPLDFSFRSFALWIILFILSVRSSVGRKLLFRPYLPYHNVSFISISFLSDTFLFTARRGVPSAYTECNEISKF